MATTTANQQTVAPAKRGKFKRFLLVAIAAIVLLGASAGGAYLKFGKMVHGPAKPAPLPPPVFFPLESLTVNLQTDDGIMHYLRIGLTLKLQGEKSQAALTERMPEIRSRVLLLLSGKHPEELATIDGKRKLASELRTAIETAGSTRDQPAHVDEVLFTEFVIQ